MEHNAKPIRQPKYGFKRETNVPKNLKKIARLKYSLKGFWRSVRVGKSMTKILGPQYVRSHDMIEIDITYRCNLNCYNCNRSIRQAPEALDISIPQITAFVRESIDKKVKWKRIRVLGGEPTQHPSFLEVIAELEEYIKFNADCEIQVVSNGYGDAVKTMLRRLPKHIWVENSNKKGPEQKGFAPFNMAPCDNLAFLHCDYTNGCAIMHECGIGLTPMGYYPCAITGGIDRIAQMELGYKHIPDRADNMSHILKQLCGFCGRFADGHYIPKNLRKPLKGEPISPAWKALYSKWNYKNKYTDDSIKASN